MASSLHNQHAVVTGGGRGLGAAISMALAREGANVTVMGRTATTLQEQAELIRRETGVRTASILCDVADADSVAHAFGEAGRALGPVQILVNNAGQADAALIQDTPLEAWERLLRVNLTGVFLCVQQVLGSMTTSGSGRIVNVASTAGLKGYAKVGAYTASKHGVIGLTRTLALEVARSGVTVNAVCPGYAEDTDMLRTAVMNVMRSTGKSEQDARAILARQSPRGTFVTPAEVAATVAWLCSPAASAITGQAIAVAGGEVM
jgi:NAD(P)-dependent dehydrogenase (short-subunit alcohol dehydrogenase family)